MTDKFNSELGQGSPEDKRGEGMRFNVGKPPMEFAPIHLLAGASQVFKIVTEREHNPYPIWNWAKGMPWTVPYACMLRHLGAWFRGEDIDPDSGHPHLDHVHCNLLMLLHYRDAFKEGDNRPTKYFQLGGMSDELVS